MAESNGNSNGRKKGKGSNGKKQSPAGSSPVRGPAPGVDPGLYWAKKALAEQLWRREDGNRRAIQYPTRRLADAVANARAHIHTIGIGYKQVNGRETRQLALRVYVAQKLPEAVMRPEDRIPKQIDGYPTDVVVAAPPALISKPATAMRARKTRGARSRKTGVPFPPIPVPAICSALRKTALRPMIAGTSCGVSTVASTGTIGCFVCSYREGDDPLDAYILSNNHVLADDNKVAPGTAIYQPGRVDGGDADDTVAELSRFVEIKPEIFQGFPTNTVDAAIAKVKSGIETYGPKVCELGRIEVVATPALGMQVGKMGRTSGVTFGFVTDVSADFAVPFGEGWAYFVDQIMVRSWIWYPPLHIKVPFSSPGDSGSLALDAHSNDAVGLLFAATSDGEYGFLNPMLEVLNALEIRLDYRDHRT